MGFDANWLLLPALVLAAINAASLLAKTEGFRGAGRVGGGLSTVLIGVFVASLACGQQGVPSTYGIVGFGLILTGLVTVASGARKFLRRNLS